MLLRTAAILLVLTPSVLGLVQAGQSVIRSTSTQHGLLPADLLKAAEARLMERFFKIDLHTRNTMNKILRIFEEERIDASAFHGVNGYGYGDIGREKLDNVVAKLLGSEAALVRLQFFSGTHAISTALFSCLRPGDGLLGVSGHPYDTLEEVIGLRDGSQTGSRAGSLLDWGIHYKEIDLSYERTDKSGLGNSVSFDLESIDKSLTEDPSIKLNNNASTNRSCGYQWRPSIPIQEIRRVCEHINNKHKCAGRDLVIFVDNCYGELVEELEPCHVGADLVAGSLIKNLGGTLAPSGGYIAGNQNLINAAAATLSAPGVEGGATFNLYRTLFQGLFMAPSIVGESLKGAELIAEVMQNDFGFPCNPPPGGQRTDIIQAVQLGSRDKLISFCEGVQKKSPVGAYIRPVPGATSGYGGEVIFADGTFTEGSTLELSADGPLREPFVAYSQGATHWTHWSIVLEDVLSRSSFAKSLSPDVVQN